METDKIKVLYEFSQQADAEQKERTIQEIRDILKDALFEYLEKIPKSTDVRKASQSTVTRKGEAQ